MDFDATASQRPFYGALLRRLKPRLPATTPLSITALASWCMQDAWMDDLPIDEAVPMLFRLGNARSAAERDEAANRIGAMCGSAAGLSLDEPVARAWPRRRLYVFNPRRWSSQDVAAARQEMIR